MSERTATYLGKDILHLEGPELEAGDDAPEVELVEQWGQTLPLIG